VSLVDPPENNPYSDRVRFGAQPPWLGGWRYASGLRFTSVGVPQGATVVSARLSLNYKYHSGLPVNLLIWGEAADHSEPFMDDKTLVHLRPRTAASVAWSITEAPSGWFEAPDVTDLVQEIVNRPGWFAGSALSLVFESASGNMHNVNAKSYDFDPQQAPMLEICYYADGGSGPVSTATPTPTLSAPTPTPTSASGSTPTPTRASGTPTPTRRPSPGTKQGIAWLYPDTISAQELAAIGVKAVHHWGYNVSFALSAINAGLVYYPMQWGCSKGASSVNESAIRAFVNASNKLKGLTWLAFNEPELAHQAGCTPLQAARAFHKLDQILRSGSNPADPTAKLYCCGTVHSSISVNWLPDFRDAYYNEYGEEPPIDGVHIHLYWGERNRLDWCRMRNHLDNFRSWQSNQPWMAGKPVIVSEWGVLSNSSQYPNDPQYLVGNCTPGCTCDYMAQMWNVFEQRGYVRHYLWWTTYANPNKASEYWDNGNVFTNRYGSQLTNPVGLKYRALSTGN